MKSFELDLATLQTVAAAALDENGVLLEANAGFLRLLPAEVQAPLGAPAARFFIQPAFRPLLAAAGNIGDPGYSGWMTIGDQAGTTRTLRGRARRTEQGLHVLAEYDVAALEKLNDLILGINRDSTVAQQALTTANVALKRREVLIVESSLTDALTGVGNRRKLEQSLDTEISRVRRGEGPLSVIMADIDHFKRVNDVFGHGAGDKVLSRFGAILRMETRPTDVVARFGGEEFFVLMPHTSLAPAAAKAEMIRAALAAEVIPPLTAPVTSSFGVAELLPAENAEALMSRVDAALYRAKEAGRDRVAQSPA